MNLTLYTSLFADLLEVDDCIKVAMCWEVKLIQVLFNIFRSIRRRYRVKIQRARESKNISIVLFHFEKAPLILFMPLDLVCVNDCVSHKLHS